MNGFFISKFRRAMREGEVMANLPWPFFETETHNEKNAQKYVLFWVYSRAFCLRIYPYLF